MGEVSRHRSRVQLGTRLPCSETVPTAGSLESGLWNQESRRQNSDMEEDRMLEV